MGSKFERQVTLPAKDLPEKEGNSNTFRTILITSGAYHFGYYIGIFNPLANPLLTHIYNIKEENELAAIEGNINMFFTIGALMAVLFSGKLADSIGRIKLLTYIELLSVMNYLLYSFEDLTALLAARFLSGMISSTNVAIALVAIKEMMPAPKVDLGGLFLYLSLTGFILIAWLANPIYGNNDDILASHWRWLLVWPVLISIPRLVFLLMKFNFCALESPQYWLQKLQHETEEDELRGKLDGWYSRVYDESVCT